jgi:pimeloyl-ACP methyl ester carboxylesterase
LLQPVRVPPGQTGWMSYTNNGIPSDIIKLQVNKRYQEKGYNSIVDHLKFFISTEIIRTEGLEQPGLELAAAENRVVAKGLGDEDLARPSNDWRTELIGLRTTRPLTTAQLEPGKAVAIGGITIAGNNQLRASVSMSSSAVIRRSTGPEAPPPPNAAYGNTLLEPFDLSPSTRSGSVMDVLELFAVEHADSVTEDEELTITLMGRRRVESGEVGGASRSMEGGGGTGTADWRMGGEAAEPVLAIGYDEATKSYFPLGYSNDEGSILIRRLPEETESDAAVTQRSLGKSIKIYFQKVIGQRLGFAYPYPRLAIAQVDESGQVSYDSDMEAIKKAVAATDKEVLLFIHGIIGDTETIVPCIRTPLNAQGDTLTKNRGLVLTFDYENLNTPIEKTASLLKRKLDEVGFAKGEPKKLIIVAHSMGGLVSRFYIEQFSGNEVVKELIMLGTPNNGTPWADVRDMAEALLTFAINGAAFLKPWTLVLSVLGKLAKGTQVTLKEMDAKTGIYEKLNLGKDPGIPYKIIAGNTKEILVNYGNVTSLLGRLFKRISTRGAYDVLDKVLFREDNDIAASDPSILTLEGADGWTDKPRVEIVASDHLSYFRLPAVLGLV